MRGLPSGSGEKRALVEPGARERGRHPAAELGARDVFEGRASRAVEAGAVEAGRHDARAADAVSLAAFRVLQEALNNVVRHAGATRVEVTVRFDGGLALTVDDDGVGMPEADARGRGMGMIGMRERVRALGGTVVFEARPGGGTRVRCALPAPSVAGAR